MPRIHDRLKAAIEVREHRYLWHPDDGIDFVPRLCSKVFGDGRALLRLETINGRPAYYVIRIDSTWNVGADCNAPDDAPDLYDHLDDIYQAIEDDFGAARWAEDEDVQADGPEAVEAMRAWPAFDDSGSAWGRMDWPRLRGIMFAAHPFACHWTILVAATPARAIWRERRRRRARLRKRRGW